MIGLKDKRLQKIYFKDKLINRVYLKDVLVYGGFPEPPTNLLAVIDSVATPTGIYLETLIDLTYSNITDTTLSLSWTQADLKGRTEQSYHIYEDGILLGSVGVNYSTSLTGLTQGQTYLYKIKCIFTDATSSDFSNEVSVTMLAGFGWSYTEFILFESGGTAYINLDTTEALRSGDPEPAISDFNVPGYTITDVFVNVFFTDVRLTLSTIPSVGETVTVDYTKGTNPIYNDIGESLPSFSNKTVVNQI